ncbi:hypothetical protein [Armatimonas sp.]|uniref:hypothetical protein n=1 Tax=Armatimonas sp. TaxID=1872638 RepID=UPI0037508487
MIPEEITNESWDDEAFAALLKRASSAPDIAPLPPGLSQRIAAATYARPTFWDKLALVLRPAPARFALGGALTAAALCVIVVPRLSKTEISSPPKIVSPPQSDRVAPPQVVIRDQAAPTPAPIISVRVTTPKKLSAPKPIPAPVLTAAHVPPIMQPTPAARIAPQESTLEDHGNITVARPTSVADAHTSTVVPEPAARLGGALSTATARSSTKSDSEALPTPAPSIAQPIVVATRQLGENSGILDDTGNLQTHTKRVKINLGLSDRERASMTKPTQIDSLTARNSESAPAGAGLGFGLPIQ